MSLSMRLSRATPSFLDLVSPELRSQWTEDLLQALQPLDVSQKISAELDSVLYSNRLLGDLFGDRWKPEVLNRLANVLPLYLEARGSIKGVRILVEKLAGLPRFQILERQLPGEESFVGDLRLGMEHRVFSDQSRARLFMIQFDHYEYELKRMSRDELRALIESEIPSHLKCVLSFKVDEKIKPSPRLNRIQIGERI